MVLEASHPGCYARRGLVPAHRMNRVARILIVGGGCRGRLLASRLLDEGHAVRITTRAEAGRRAIEAAGAECWIGTPGRLATLHAALENVTIACWLLAGATGPPRELEALHSSRLQFFLGRAIDTTVRGVIYDASAGAVAAGVLAEGERIARSLAQLNAIPLAVLRAEPGAGREERWIAAASAAVDSLLWGQSTAPEAVHAGAPSSAPSGAPPLGPSGAPPLVRYPDR
jgi:nucleoside-diphosphate-sugar epimerase